MAYSISDKQDTGFVLDTLGQLPALPGTMLHSDQGSVYTSQAHQEPVKGIGITMTMTIYLEGLACSTTAIVEQTVRDYIITQFAFKQN